MEIKKKPGLPFYRVIVLVGLLSGLLLSACGETSNGSGVATGQPSLPSTTAPVATTLPTTARAVAPTTAPARNAAGLGRADSMRRDITYCSAEGVDLKLDVYLPTRTEVKPAPAVVYVHGGSWVGGSKDSAEVRTLVPPLAARGYVVAAINYRLAPRYKFPAQIEDVKCAVRYLRANAASYNLDPERIGAWGSSAGGHLVSLLGLTDSGAGFEGNGGHAGQSSKVQAVVDMFGPADLTMDSNGLKMNLTLQQLEMLAQAVFGSTDNLKKASPVTYIHKNAPPFLILQGDKDDIVPPIQSQEFYDKLKAAGVPATLVMVKNAGHGFVPRGGPINPSALELAQTIAAFFDKHLK